MTRRSDFRVRASFPAGSSPRVALDYFCSCFKTFPHKHVCTSASHRFDFHVLACFSNYFLPHLVFVSPPLLIYWRMLSQSSLLTTCRPRQVCWWRRFTQAQWYKVTAAENSPEVHEEMILTERSVKLSHMTPSHLTFASSVFLLPHAAQQVRTVTLF